MNFLYRIYFFFPNCSRIGFIGKVIDKGLAFVLKRVFDAFVPHYLKRTAAKAGYGLNTEPRGEYYIVSLTSFPARINDIWITIETILRQSFKPDKIILWLAEKQFPDKKLPKNLIYLKKRGLTIMFCEDLKSHKKYFFSMKNFENANIITVDDDVYYPKHFLKYLITLHHKYPNVICANRVHLISFKNNIVQPYRKWKHNFKKITIPSHLLVQVGVGGVLYPPKSLHKEVFNKELFKSICFYADDLWLKIMALKNNTMVVTNKKYNKDFPTVTSTQKQKLVSTNVLKGENDQQLKNVCEYFAIDFKSLR